MPVLMASTDEIDDNFTQPRDGFDQGKEDSEDKTSLFRHFFGQTLQWASNTTSLIALKTFQNSISHALKHLLKMHYHR
jgi:hypothetical protein